jgi:DNA invertase Pin-like site-specific DNA recombinase
MDPKFLQFGYMHLDLRSLPVYARAFGKAAIKMEGMKTVLYVRASTEDQILTLEAQRTKLVAYAGVFDLEIVEVIEDAGESAKSLSRPGLQRALALMRSGAADGLVVAKLDRLTRNIGDWQWLITEFFGESGGKALLSLGDSVDTRSAAGRLVLNMMLSVAAWEREVIAERTKEALSTKIKRGERVGSVRFGFDLSADGKSLVPNAREQEAIALMIQWRHEGDTLRGIAAGLNELGIPTKEGAPWAFGSVARILRRADASKAA